MDHYLELVARSSLPTSEQTDRFADHVATNHSWYKHLPFFPPGASFVFFLNPHAGKGVSLNDGFPEVYELDRGDYFSHHSRLSTRDYFEQFGHWDYWVDDNPRSTNPRHGPLICSFDGNRWDMLPEELRHRWSCRFTAFLWPSPSMFELSRHSLTEEQRAFRSYAREYPMAPEVVHCRQLHEALARALGDGERLWPLGDPMRSLVAAEAEAQKERLLSTLRRVREECTRVRHDGR